MPCLSLIFWRTEEFGGGLDLLVLEVLERDAALDQLLREDLDDGLERVLVLAGELNGLFLFELDRGLGVLEVEAGVTSLVAWSMAFFTSWISTLLTTSKLLSDAIVFLMDSFVRLRLCRLCEGSSVWKFFAVVSG